MLKSYLAFFFLFIFYASFAQIKIGVMGGPQSSSPREKNDVPNWNANTGRFNTNHPGFHDGVVDEKDGNKNVVDSIIKDERLPVDTIHRELAVENSSSLNTTDSTDKNDNTVNEESGKQFQNISQEKILFSFNSASLNDASIRSLKKLINFIKENPTVKLNVEGYTDNIGATKINMQIAAERANAIKDYLVEKRIAPGRISTKALVNTNPIANNNTKAGRAKNRRVELKMN